MHSQELVERLAEIAGELLDICQKQALVIAQHEADDSIELKRERSRCDGREAAGKK